MPDEVEDYTVPHFKAPINGKVELWQTGCGDTFILYYSSVKIGHLLHKLRPVPFVSSSTVWLHNGKIFTATEICMSKDCDSKIPL